MIRVDDTKFLSELRNPDQDDLLSNLGLKAVSYLDLLGE